MTPNKKGLIQYLETNTKQDRDSWDSLSTKYSFRNGEAARMCWRKHRLSKLDKNTNTVTKKEEIKNISNNIETTNLSFLSFLSTFKTPNIPLPYNPIDSLSCVYLSITDAHLDRLTTTNSQLLETVNNYYKAVHNLISQATRLTAIDEIVYVIGNDLFNSDTYFNTTTNGTQQQDNSIYSYSYEKIFEVQVKCIMMLKKYCNTLHIKFVPGNHDRTKGFYLVHALSVYFSNDNHIIFDREATNTKCYTYGNNFIGMHHGDTKIEALPLYFATRYGEQFGKARYREIAVGDKHSKKSWFYRMKLGENEDNGVRVFMTPSLSDNSLWEKNNLYDTGIKSGICRIYDKEKGKFAELEYRA